MSDDQETSLPTRLANSVRGCEWGSCKEQPVAVVMYGQEPHGWSAYMCAHHAAREQGENMACTGARYHA